MYLIFHLQKSTGENVCKKERTLLLNFAIVQLLTEIMPYCKEAVSCRTYPSIATNVFWIFLMYSPYRILPRMLFTSIPKDSVIHYAQEQEKQSLKELSVATKNYCCFVHTISKLYRPNWPNPIGTKREHIRNHFFTVRVIVVQSDPRRIRK